MDRAAGIGISDDHQALAATARRWTTSNDVTGAARAALDAADDALPAFWEALAELGWLGLHLPAEVGGEGFGMAELAVVVEELGRAGAPGPFVPTVVVSAVLHRFGAPGAERDDLLAGLAGGRLVGAIALGCPPVEARAVDGGMVVDGAWPTVVSAAVAQVIALPISVPGTPLDTETWAVVDAEALHVVPCPSADATRRVGEVEASEVLVPGARLLEAPAGAGGVTGLAAVVLGAEAVGIATWCTETASEHALVREQFGRPIGQFQAVKHRCADMRCALELARAALWAAVTPPTGAEHPGAIEVATAGAVAPEAAYRCAMDCVQVLGGIGFTWEHDAHVYLKRALATRLLLGGAGPWRAEVARRARDGARVELRVELPPEAEAVRGQVRAFVDELTALPRAEWNRRLADSGYLVPHWPVPWGRDASPIEQLVIDEELRAARVRRPHLAVGAWALPTIIGHGTPEQQERWVPATLRGEITWCQMFSEPGAGSDLASLSTKAVRTDGGWLLTGQKVWTSMAREATWGICLARTDPSAPRHEGIGCFLVDMASEGIDIRPLRELTGAEMFNEVFLSDVFVPDDCVVGAPTAGWQAARTTLANERVSMGQGSSMGPAAEALVDLAGDRLLHDERLADVVGDVLADTMALAAMGVRLTQRTVEGRGHGPEASIRKLLGVELDQRVQEVGLEVLGAEGATGDGLGALWLGGFLGNRSLSIAGGTSEIQRNVIAERLLGLPRDP